MEKETRIKVYQLVDDDLGPEYSPIINEDVEKKLMGKNIENLVLDVFSYEEMPEEDDIKYDLDSFFDDLTYGKSEYILNDFYKNIGFKAFKEVFDKELEKAEEDIGYWTNAYYMARQNISNINKININYVPEAEEFVKAQEITREVMGRENKLLTEEQLETLNGGLKEMYKDHENKIK